MRLRQAVRLGGLVVGLAMFGAGSANAAIITYTTQASWEAAVAAAGLGVTVEDFADATLQPGVTIDDASISGGVYNGTALTQFNDAGNPKLNFTGTQAFGGFWDFTAAGPGDGLVFMVNGGFAAFQGNPADGSSFSGFIGFVSNDATLITSVRLDSPGTGVENFTLDDLRYTAGQAGPGGGDDGGGTQVPEPSSLLLLATGVCGCLGSARRKQARV